MARRYTSLSLDCALRGGRLNWQRYASDRRPPGRIGGPASSLAGRRPRFPLGGAAAFRPRRIPCARIGKAKNEKAKNEKRARGPPSAGWSCWGGAAGGGLGGKARACCCLM